LQVVARCGQRIGFILGLGVCALIARAEAQEYCVACTEPPALYRCVIDGARPGGRHPLQTLCIVAMTKEGRHGACSVKGGTVFDCNGPVRRVPWAAYNGAAVPAPPAPPPTVQAPNKPPRTVEEMVKRANEKTSEQVKETDDNKGKRQADTLGETTKKSWQCLSSLFTRCGE
jgi:hypothetical protein